MIGNAELVESLHDKLLEAFHQCEFRTRSYSSYPRFYHFIKYLIPIKDPTRKRRSFHSLAVLNLTKKSNMFANMSDEEIRDTIQEQILMHKNSSVSCN